LPDAAIAPVRRADGSGTTFLFTSYLSKVNAEWKAKVGENSAGRIGPLAPAERATKAFPLLWHVCPIQSAMLNTPTSNRISCPMFCLQNADGHFVAPDDTAFKAAAAGADWSKSFNQIITNMPGKDSWPISWCHFHPDARQARQPCQGLGDTEVFPLGLPKRRQYGTDLEYVPMPKSVVAAMEKLWGEVKDGAGKPVWTK
jgi:phosphate transport system substrate-binding protein